MKKITRFIEVHRENGGILRTAYRVPKHPRSENATSRMYMYSIDMHSITYLEYYSRLSETCILNMPIIHLLSRTKQFLGVHPEYGATSERYSVLKDHPIRKLPQFLGCLNTHSIDTASVH